MVAVLLLVSFTAPRWSRWVDRGGVASSAGVVDVPPAAPEAPEGVSGRIHVQLFFQSRTHSSLVAEERAVRFSPELYRQIELALEELIRGPEDPALLPTLPPATRLGEMFILDGGVAVVTLTLPSAPVPESAGGGADAEAAAAKAPAAGTAGQPVDPGPHVLRGSKEELLSVYSIVNSVVVNFPAVRRVRLLVELRGDGLGAHVDLRHPLPADMTLVLPPEEWQLGAGGATAGASAEAPEATSEGGA